MKKLLAMGLVGLLASSAYAGFSSGPYNGINSASAIGAVGSANSPPIVHNHAGPAFTPGTFTVMGDLTNNGIGTFANEARFRVTSAGGQIYNSSAHSPVGGAFTTLAINNTQTLPAAFQTAGPGNSVGNWSFAPFESFDDGGAAGIDATWNNLNLAINDFVPPVAPTATHLGTYALNDNFKFRGAIAGTEVDWYTVTTTGIQSLVFDTSKTISIPISQAMEDTEIGVYNSIGDRLGNDDDSGFDFYSRLSLTNLPAGTYYVAVGKYNTTFDATGWAVTSTNLSSDGDYWLNISPEPATLGLLAVGALAMLRRRR